MTEYEKAGKLCYFPLVQNPDENWTLGQGRVNKEMIRSLMPEPISENREEDDSVIIVCGPPKLKESVAKIIDEIGWNNVFIYK